MKKHPLQNFVDCFIFWDYWQKSKTKQNFDTLHLVNMDFQLKIMLYKTS